MEDDEALNLGDEELIGDGDGDGDDDDEDEEDDDGDHHHRRRRHRRAWQFSMSEAAKEDLQAKEEEQEEDLEEGEIGNELDMAVRVAKDSVIQARLQVPKKKRKKKSRRRKRKNTQTEDVQKFILRTAQRLQEGKLFLVEAAVSKLGVQAISELVKEVEAIEIHGGQMTSDGKRRRTPGGILWNILKSRVHPNIYKDIMSKGKEHEKQPKKERSKRHRMDIDEQHSTKRMKSSGASYLDEAGKVDETTQYLEELPDGLTGISVRTCSVENDPDSLPKASDVQVAWINAVKKPREKWVCPGIRSLKNEEPVKKNPAPLADRLRMPVGYEDLLET